MQTDYDPNLQATVTRDEHGRVRRILYFDKLKEMPNLRGRAAAEAYIRDTFNVAPERLRSTVSFVDPRQQGIEYRFSEEKASFDTVTYTYYQTFLNAPVWGGGITVTIKQARTGAAHVVAATDTSVQDVGAKLPSPADLERFRRLFATGEGGKTQKPEIPDSDPLIEILGPAVKVALGLDGKLTAPRLIRGRFFIYPYDAKARTKNDSPQTKLPLPAVSKSIQDKGWYLAAELVFSLPYGHTRKNWRIVVELETNTILSVREMSSGVKGNVFIYDPMTRGLDMMANSSDDFNPHRQLEELRNLNPSKGGVQSLEGKFAKVVSITSPNFRPPTCRAGRDFDKFSVRTNQFAAVNAYYHVDRFFRLVEDLGFKVIGSNSYFKDTKFPVEVDHRAFRAPWPDGNVVNAALEGRGQGIDSVYFALAHFEDGFVSGVTVTCGGKGYTRATKVKLKGGDGSGATAEVKVIGGAVKAVTVVKRGNFYSVGPLVEFGDKGGGTGAFATAKIDVANPIGIATDWRVTLHELGGHGILWCHLEDDQFKFAHSAGDCFAMILTDYGSAFHDPDLDSFSKPDRFLLLPFEPLAIPRRSDRGVNEHSVARVNVTDPGKDYLTVRLEEKGRVKEAKAIAHVAGGEVTKVTLKGGGKGYTSAPSVNFSGGRGGTGAAATAQFDSVSGSVTGVKLTEQGSGYVTPPMVNFVGDGPARLGVLNTHFIRGKITKVTIRDPGAGYEDGSYKVIFSGGGGKGAAATAQVVGGTLAKVTVTKGGRGYSPLVVELSEGDAVAQIVPEDIVDGRVTKVTVADPGMGYRRGRAPRVKISGGGGRGAKAIAKLGTWGWGGGMDQGTEGRIGGGYFSEQILSTTMFRAYRSIGGDAKSFKRREFAARYMAYLMLRAVGNLSKEVRNPETPGDLLRELQGADKGDWTSEKVVGNAYGKVLAWAFEKQNLEDALPTGVDVYIDDGRAGGYEPFKDEVFWATTAIWNRRSRDGLDGHQEPALGATNFAYVKIKNRGNSVANDVIVKGYHCKPSAGLLWPNDLQEMTPPPQPAAETLQPNNAEEKTVGPFKWTPVAGGFGHDCMLMVVSETRDASNVENITARAAIEGWRLVPSDNNIAQRNVVLVPGGDGVQGLMAALNGKGLWVRNPGRSAAKIAVSVALPPLLARRKWKIEPDLPAGGVKLNARKQRLVTYDVQAGRPFTKADVKAASASKRKIVVTATANGAIIGGITYVLDPELDAPFNERAAKS